MEAPCLLLPVPAVAGFALPPLPSCGVRKSGIFIIYSTMTS